MVSSGWERSRATKSWSSRGAGPLGNFATAVARDHGAKQVLVIGAPAARWEVTKRMGADGVLNLEEVTDPKDRRQCVRDHSDGRGADGVRQAANNTAVPVGPPLRPH